MPSPHILVNPDPRGMRRRQQENLMLADMQGWTVQAKEQ